MDAFRTLMFAPADPSPDDVDVMNRAFTPMASQVARHATQRVLAITRNVAGGHE
jgi:hypothetical protein